MRFVAGRAGGINRKDNGSVVEVKSKGRKPLNHHRYENQDILHDIPITITEGSIRKWIQVPAEQKIRFLEELIELKSMLSVGFEEHNKNKDKDKIFY